MLLFRLLQIGCNKCKINLQVAGLEPAICVSIVQLTAECVYQFRHTCKSKIHNGSIKLDWFQLNANQSLFFNSNEFYQ